MPTIEINEANIDGEVKKGGILLLDFWAAWCGPCRSFSPVFEAASNKYPDITFGKIDTDKEQALAQAFQVRGIPMLAAFRDGVLLFSQAGALPAEAVDELVEKLQSLDMDAVRAEIAAQSAPQSGSGA